MLDGDRVSGRPTTSKNNNTGNASTNNVFSSSDVEEDFDEGFPGPSTSNYNNGTSVDDLSHYTEDLDLKEQGNMRQLFSELLHLLDQDSVFHRIRKEIVGDLDRMAQEHQYTDNKQLTHRQRFDFLERLDDFLDTANDINEAHLAVLRHVALQLSNHAPLEVMNNDFDLEHLFVMPEKQKTNGISDNTISPAKKMRKSRNAEESKLSGKLQQNNDAAYLKTGSTIQLNEDENIREGTSLTKTNGFHSNNGEKTNESTLFLSRSAENERSVNGGRISADCVDTKTDDQSANNAKNSGSSSKFDSDNSSNVDVKESRNNEKLKKRDLKKPFKKPINNKPNGVSKTLKSEKFGNRRASERQGSKSSRTPEPESKKFKRRTATASIISETVNDMGVRRRTTRNTQLNSELSNIDEQTYCICDQISFGQMIGCDNSNCKIEWFHFDCVGLKIKPAKGQKWYCPSCRGPSSTAMKSNSRK